MKYFVYAYPALYGGRYGMYDWTIYDGEYANACEEGFSLCCEVLDRYGIADEIYSEEDYRNEYDIKGNRELTLNEYNEFNQIQTELIGNEIYYIVLPLKADVDEEEIWHCNDDPKDIIKKYCEGII